MPPVSMETERRRRRLRGDGNDALWEQAQLACRHALAAAFDDCVDDVMVTGDLTFAEGY